MVNVRNGENRDGIRPVYGKLGVDLITKPLCRYFWFYVSLIGSSSKWLGVGRRR